MDDAEVLAQIEAEIEQLGKEMQSKVKLAVEILRGRVATVRGNRYRIESGKIYFGGMGARLYFDGPRLKANGEPMAVARESCPIGLMEKIERV